MQGLGLLARKHRPIRRLIRPDVPLSARSIFVGPSPARNPCAGLAGGAKCNSIEPGAEQVGVSDRPRLTCEDEEHSLEGVFGVMVVAEELAAHSKHHRAMAFHDRRECRLAGIFPTRGKPIEQLPV
jgi:hypothetical protein